MRQRHYGSAFMSRSSSTFAKNMLAATTARSQAWLGLLETALASLVIVGGWCVIDYFGVRQPDYPARIHDNEWLILVLPVAALLTCLCMERLSRQRWAFFLPVISTGIAILLSIPLILTFGIWFHFSIGGNL